MSKKVTFSDFDLVYIIPNRKQNDRYLLTKNGILLKKKKIQENYIYKKIGRFSIIIFICLIGLLIY